MENLCNVPPLTIKEKLVCVVVIYDTIKMTYPNITNEELVFCLDILKRLIIENETLNVKL